MLLMKRLPLNSYRFRPRAPRVPMTTEITVASTAMTREYHRLPMRASFSSSLPYHWVVKPFQ